jgi:heat shock protein HtpX
MNRLKTVVLLAALAGLFIVIGYAIGGKTGATIALIIAVVMNFTSYWFSDKIVLSMYGAQEISENDDPRLFHMIQQLAMKAGLPMPRVYIIPEEAPNAFATGRNPEHAAVAVTEGIMRLLSYEELAGVIGHELSHVKHRDILIQSIAATIGAAIVYLAQIGQFSMLFGGRRSDEDEDEGGGRGSFITSILMIILAPIAAMLIQMAISRSREYMADDSGADICGHPMWLASALDKLRRGNEAIPTQHGDPATAHMFIVQPFFGGGMSNLFSTHPPIEERIERLQEKAGIH